jgi:mannosyltransferase OCH1-like enzyme
MKLSTIIIVISIVLVILAGIYVARRDMIFRDRHVYSYRPPQNPQPFPKIIHQTWKTKDLTETQRKWQESVRNLYPDYQYILWDDTDIENFVKQYFSYYYETWKNLHPFIKKVDAVRYMWMYLIGGIYFDLDVVGMKRMDDLLLDKPGSAFIPTMNSTPDWAYDTDAASPAILASYPGNPIWLEMLEQIRNTMDRPVLKCTGPIGLANLLREIHTRPEDEKPNLVFLSESRLGLGFKLPKYSKHINTGTWL